MRNLSGSSCSLCTNQLTMKSLLSGVCLKVCHCGWTWVLTCGKMLPRTHIMRQPLPCDNNDDAEDITEDNTWHPGQGQEEVATGDICERIFNWCSDWFSDTHPHPTLETSTPWVSPWLSLYILAMNMKACVWLLMADLLLVSVNCDL